MLIEQALKTILSASPGVVAIAGTRVYPGYLSQTTLYPAVAYRAINRDREPVLTGKETGPPVARFIFFSVVKTHADYLTLKELDEQLRIALHGYSGTVVLPNSSPVESLNILGIFFRDSYGTYGDSSEMYDPKTGTFQTVSVYDVHYQEQVPD